MIPAILIGTGPGLSGCMSILNLTRRVRILSGFGLMKEE